MMMGGKNYELSPEEHIFAAVQIYIDVVYIFMFLLLLTGGSEWISAKYQVNEDDVVPFGKCMKVISREC